MYRANRFLQRLAFSVDSKAYHIMSNPFNGSKEKIIISLPVSSITSKYTDFISNQIEEPDTSPSEVIVESVIAIPGFHLRNQGITIIAEKVAYDNRYCEGIICMDMDKGHGIVDGIKTLYSILSANRKAEGEKLRQSVMIEIIISSDDGFNIQRFRDMKNLTAG